MPPPMPIRLHTARKLFSSSIRAADGANLSRACSPFRPVQTCRSISSTPFLWGSKKKKGQDPVDEDIQETRPSKGSKSSKKGSKAAKSVEESPGSDEDPHKLEWFEGRVAQCVDRLKSDLSKLRSGGRFNPETVENVRVKLEKDGKDTERLGDLAQVIPKGGRSLTVLVGDKEHVKPVMAAIQATKDLNLQPQPDAHNPVQLNIPIPPPTKESRNAVVQQAKEHGADAQRVLAKFRGDVNKAIRAHEVAKTTRPDDLVKAKKRMDTINTNASKQIKAIEDEAVKALSQ
ncbi:hypothetical protein BP6252_07092 [Coleophoma cylindrospora]|uniref:Ribosome recycling factor domain-containing protein n=1 Tax=Coleophoma cylindrospora TaxID=1849047 RepID=A0A3D8RGK2_9HELO|nr:hypothetical protein BP6252_07092 [Coleophoma cylindrospora]